MTVDGGDVLIDNAGDVLIDTAGEAVTGDAVTPDPGWDRGPPRGRGNRAAGTGD